MTRPTVLLGMSGGVDSRRRFLLVRQGYDVHGVTLQVWEHEDEQVAAFQRWRSVAVARLALPSSSRSAWTSLTKSLTAAKHFNKG